MLRNLIMLLVLINVLLLIWSYWIQPPPVANPSALTDQTAPQLVLVQNDPEPEQPVSPIAGDDALSCYRLGPFSESGPADAMASTFSEQGFRATRRREAARPACRDAISAE